MGVVYRAEDTRLGREVALKFLPADTSHDPQMGQARRAGRCGRSHRGGDGLPEYVTSAESACLQADFRGLRRDPATRVDALFRERGFERYVYAFERVMPHIGHLRLDRIHNDTLASYRRARRADGVSAGTINKELSCVRRVLNLVARVWRHENGMSWLEAPPLIEMEKGGTRKPYPLSWEVQDRLFRELPAHLQRIGPL